MMAFVVVFLVPVSILFVFLLGIATLGQALSKRYHIAIISGIGMLGWLVVLYFSISKPLGQ
ncbi:MAG: hypothetical protein U1A25_03260 [Candidatus Sungbacteria bacterium]|nr:hypothetical protein [bacterium]MDZ4260662.1 hypothetical protein [Candidatus Sungbacteria bacterium]